MRGKLFYSNVAIFFFTAILTANTINVPNDYSSIQEGIDNAVDGDTVLVAEGTYVENVNFSGKNITVGSLFLTDGDTSHISKTIIDGDQSGHVIEFSNAETISSILIGFTITNGLSANGGGIYCNGSSPTLKNLIINENEATSSGGGIYLYNSNPTLSNVVISENESEYDGGGINCYSSSPTINRAAIYANTTKWNGGGISCFYNSHPTLTNVTISNNTAYQDGCGIACLYNSSVDLLNSIIWNNNNHEIFVASSGELTVEYSDILGGSAGIETLGNAIVNWIEGNINEDPLFVDPFNNDYNLHPASPCIDAGDPDPAYNDPDGTRNDMGAYSFRQSGIRGTVTINQEPGNVEDVVIEVTGDIITSVNPSEDGSYAVILTAGTYNVTASLDGYYPYPISYDNLVVVEGELVSGIDFNMNRILPGSVEGKVGLEDLGDVTSVQIAAGGEITSPYPVYDSLGDLLYYYYTLEITPGIYDVTASLAGYQDSTVTDVIVQSMEQTLDIDFILKPITYLGYIAGTVTLKSGPGNVEDVVVSVPGFAPVHPDANGDYLLTAENGTFDVTASLEEYTSVTIRDVIVIPDQTATGVNMTLMNWDVIPGTQYLMILYATASLDGEFLQGAASNQLAAFGPDVTDDCRGIAKWMEGNHPEWDKSYHYWDLDGYWYFTIVSNNQSGETISFKAFDTETDSIYDCYETIVFDDCIYDESIDLTLPSPVRNQKISLIEDWNWISFNFHTDNNSIDSVFEDLSDNNSIHQVKHENISTIYDTISGQWIGDLDYISDGEGYLVNMYKAFDPFNFSGTAINPIINTIGLIQNWNWIGYYPMISLPVQQALESIIGGDTIIVKNQTQSSICIGGSWIGDLTQMEPGGGYKLKITSSDNTYLTYPIPSSTLAKKENYFSPEVWKLLSGTTSNMIAIIKIIIDEDVINNSNKYIVGVFDEENNCRSIAKRENDFWYLTIVGNCDNEKLHFKVYDYEKETEHVSDQEIVFKHDTIVGKFNEPYAVSFKTKSVQDVSYNIPVEFELELNYPNPFNPVTTIGYSLPEAGNVRLSVYDLKGELVDILVNSYQEANHYTVNWDASKLSSGIYFYKLSYGGNSIIKRCLLIK